MRDYVLRIIPCLLLLLVACNASPMMPPPTETASPTLRVALVMKTLTNPFFVEMGRGAREAEADLDVELIVRTAAQETSIQQQIEIIDRLILDDVDAIVIALGDSVELLPVLKRAQDEGIVIVNIDNRLDADFAESLSFAPVPFISVDNEQGAYLSAQHIAELALEANDDDRIEAIIIEGIRTAQNAEDRKNGALRAFAEHDAIDVVAMESANWLIDDAYEIIGDLLADHPDTDIIFCANDIMAFGVLQYLSENDHDDILVAAYDALDEALELIQDGTLAATIDQQAAQQGYLGVEYAVRILRGEAMPSETLIDVILVTADNVDALSE